MPAAQTFLRKSAMGMLPWSLRNFLSPPQPNMMSGSSSPLSLARALVMTRGRYVMPVRVSPNVGSWLRSSSLDESCWSWTTCR